MINLRDLTEDEMKVLKEAIPFNQNSPDDPMKKDLFLKFQQVSNRRFWKDGKPDGSYNDFNVAVVNLKRRTKLNPYKNSDIDLLEKAEWVDEKNVESFKERLVTGWKSFNRLQDKRSFGK